MPNIHSTAIIEPGAEVHASTCIGPYSIIERGATIGADCIIESNVRIYGATRMGAGNRVCHGATLGAEPQDLTYTPDKSKPLTIGDNNHFKESVNISRGVKTEHGTVIGSHNYLMSLAHIGHDCVVGDHNVIANGSMLAGHVELAHHCFISGLVAVHQFARIGAYVMVSGMTGVSQDVPPFTLVDGHRAEMVGLNTVGLKRNGFDQAARTAIKAAYKVLYKSGFSRAEAMARLRADDHEAVQQLLAFIADSNRGLVAHR